jgi:hypothetical protein
MHTPLRGVLCRGGVLFRPGVISTWHLQSSLKTCQYRPAAGIPTLYSNWNLLQMLGVTTHIGSVCLLTVRSLVPIVPGAFLICTLSCSLPNTPPPPPLPPPPCRRANLSEEVQSWAEEVALDEQGHVRMIRQVRGCDRLA